MDELGHDVKKLGFGLMRLPQKDGKIDLEQTKTMVDMFLEAGFNYFDTAYGYNNGESEKAICEALVKRYPRESFKLATKLPAWSGAKNADEARAMFDTSLARTGAGYFDYYLLHNLGNERTHYFDDYGIWDFLAEKKAAGLIKHLGFSFHDNAAALDKVLTDHPEMEFVQLQINYSDWESPSVQSRLCYETARSHGKKVIIMEPVKGGSLAVLPENIASVFKKAAPDRSVSSWAVRFAASLDGVITVLSGMSDISQMKDNLDTMTNFKPLSSDERAVIAEVNRRLDATPHVPCTGCAYCVKGCAAGIDIPGVFEAYNALLVYNDMNSARSNYGWATMDAAKVSACLGCGACEAACPQHIDIIHQLAAAAEALEK